MADQEGGGSVHPLVASGEMMIVPGVYDALSAKLAERAGFPGVEGSFNGRAFSPSKKTKSVNVPPVSIPILSILYYIHIRPKVKGYS